MKKKMLPFRVKLLDSGKKNYIKLLYCCQGQLRLFSVNNTEFQVDMRKYLKQ